MSPGQYDARIAHVIGKPAIDSLYLNLFIVTADLYQRGVKCWAMLAVDTLANYSSACKSGGGYFCWTFQRKHCYVDSLILIIEQIRRFIPACRWQSEVSTSLWNF